MKSSTAVLLCSLLLGLGGLLFCPPTSSGAIIINANFDSDTLGNPPTTGPGVPTQPIGLGYKDPSFTDHNNTQGTFYSDAAAVNISYTVANVAGLNKALVMTNHATPDLDLNESYVSYVDFSAGGPATHSSRFSIDFSQLQTPGGDNTGYRSDFLVNAYSNTSLAWTLGTSHLNPNDIVLLNPSGGVYVIGTYINGVATRADVFTNFDTGTYSVYLNSTLVAANYAFYNPAAVGGQITELFIQQAAATGGPNVIALDNIVYESLPEPSGFALLAFGAALLYRRTRR